MTTLSEPPVKPAPARRRRRRLLGAAALVVAALAGYAVWTNVVPYELRTEITIDGTPDQVWTVLTDLEAYDEWNPFIVSSSGTVQPGATLTNTMRDATGEMTFTPTVLTATPGREFRWLGKLGPGGVFDGEHAFLLEPTGDGRTRLTQTETFAGVAVPFFRGQLRDNTLPQFHAMNEALARRVAGS
jgi:hypothetical protein